MDIPTFEERARKNMPEWIKVGLAIPEKDAPEIIRNCPQCGALTVFEKPFTRYGVRFDGYGEFVCPKRCDEQETTTLTIKGKDDEARPWVVLVQGVPCFISTNEKVQYLEQMNRRTGGVMIRDYVFDRLYPILPADEYQQHITSRIK